MSADVPGRETVDLAAEVERAPATRRSIHEQVARFERVASGASDDVTVRGDGQ